MYLRIDCIISYLNIFFPTNSRFNCNPKPLCIPHQGILNCLQLLAIMNNTTVDTCV